MATEDCPRIIREAAGDLSDDETEAVVSELQRRLDTPRASGALETLEEEMLNVADGLAREVVEAAQIERRNRLINLRAKSRILAFANQVDRLTGDPALALSAMDVGVKRRFPGSRQSVDARTNALETEYLGALIADLRQQDLLKLFNSRQMELDIARALERLTRPDGRPGLTENKAARDIAKIIDDVRKAAVARENRAGAWIKPLPGYITRQTHDMARIRRAGYRAWRDEILPRLDGEATFRGADPEKFLEGAYDGLVTGLHLRANGGDESDLLFAFEGPGNLAKRASKNRVPHFKSADDWFAYNERFGRGSLAEGIIGDLRRAARNTALMEAYGTNPAAMRETVLDAPREKHRGDVKKLDRLSARSLRLQFAEVTGETAIPVNPSTANINASVRAVKSMASLGGAFLSSFADLGLKAVELQRQGGRNLFQVWGDNLTSSLEGMAPGQRRAAADLIGVGLEGQTGDLAARFSATDDLPGRVAKGQQLFFKLNLLSWWTDSNKRGIGLMMARDLAMRKGLSFDALPDDTRRMLESYGLDAGKWRIAKQAVRKEADGREYLMPDAIRDLPDEVFGGSERAVRQAKDELETALRSYCVDRADFAVPTPGARERAILRQGTQPGTALGEAVRYAMQFKAFPVTVPTKVAGGLMEADSTRQFFGSLVRGKGDILGLVHMMVATTVLGYVAQSAKELSRGELSRGRTPRDPESPATWTAAMQQGGGLGILGGFLFGAFNRFGRTAVGTLAGPVPSEFGALVETLNAARRGEDSWARGGRLVTNNLPLINLFYTRLAIEYLFLFQIQESMNPGYLRRMERRIAKENGQSFLLRPSGAIPPGGDRVFEGVR